MASFIKILSTISSHFFLNLFSDNEQVETCRPKLRAQSHSNILLFSASHRTLTLTLSYLIYLLIICLLFLYLFWLCLQTISVCIRSITTGVMQFRQSSPTLMIFRTGSPSGELLLVKAKRILFYNMKQEINDKFKIKYKNDDLQCLSHSENLELSLARHSLFNNILA